MKAAIGGFAAAVVLFVAIGVTYFVTKHNDDSGSLRLSPVVQQQSDALGGVSGPLDYPNENIAVMAERYVGRWGGDACADAHRDGYTGKTNVVTQPIRKANGTIDPNTGAGSGQCRSFVNCIVWMVSSNRQWLGGGGGDYQRRFVDLGALEITRTADLRRGDIIQQGNGTHTFIFERAEGANFFVIDSNSDLREIVRGPYVRGISLGGSVRAWRLGTVQQSATTAPPISPPAATAPPTNPAAIPATQAPHTSPTPTATQPRATPPAQTSPTQPTPTATPTAVIPPTVVTPPTVTTPPPLPVFPVMNTSETPPDGVWFRNSPHTADTPKITGYGVYMGEQVRLKCYAFGDAVGAFGNTVWYYVDDLSRPVGGGRQNSGFLNAHYINDGLKTNQVDAGVPAC